MAIPSWDSKEQMTTKGTNVDMDPGMASAGSSALKSVATAFQDVTQKISDAKLVSETMKSKNESDIEVARITQQAIQDPDISPEKQQEYMEKAQLAVQNASRHITKPSARADFAQKYDSKAQLANIKLDRIYYQKFRQDAQSNYNNTISIKRAEYLQSQDLESKTSAWREVMEANAQMKATGQMSVKEADANLKILRDDFNKAHIELDINTRPQFVVEQAKLGDKGFYQGMPEDMLAKYSEKAKNAVKHYDVERSRATELNITNELAFGKPENAAYLLEEALANNTIKTNSPIYNATKRKLDSVIFATAETNNEQYYDLLEFINTKAKTPEEARAAAITANAEGHISPEELEKAMRFHLMPTEGENQSLQDIYGEAKVKGDLAASVALAEARSKIEAQKKHLGVRIWNTITAQKGKNKRAVAQAYQELNDRIKTKQLPPAEYEKEVERMKAESLVKKYPQIANFPKEGKVINGWRTFPDGRQIEEPNA